MCRQIYKINRQLLEYLPNPQFSPFVEHFWALLVKLPGVLIKKYPFPAGLPTPESPLKTEQVWEITFLQPRNSPGVSGLFTTVWENNIRESSRVCWLNIHLYTVYTSSIYTSSLFEYSLLSLTRGVLWRTWMNEEWYLSRS